MKCEDLRGVYREIAAEIDVKTATKIHEMFSGQQITFPKKLYNFDYINSFIKANFNGKNTRELSKMFGISERRIRQILSKLK
ncbi:MAG: Mor transcription activator family protein [Clostridium sp.]|nr:Mor transcription activator family protein [Clostridium sp.]